MSLEEAISAYIAKMNAATKPMRQGEWAHCCEEKRRISRKGNVVVSIVEQGEFEWGGPVEDPFFGDYESYYEAVFSPAGKLLSSRNLS